jgi:hypothetical protein
MRKKISQTAVRAQSTALIIAEAIGVSGVPRRPF